MYLYYSQQCDILEEPKVLIMFSNNVISLRTDTQITFSLHLTPLGIRLSAFVAQPGAFLVLETIIL